MYDCDEHGLSDTMERELRRQYREEQEERKDEILRMLEFGRFTGDDGYEPTFAPLSSGEREYYISVLRREFKHNYNGTQSGGK